MKEQKLTEALQHPLFLSHKIGDGYMMDGKPDQWKIAYYPIFEDGKSGEQYEEARALVERPIPGGTDFREIPLRYLTRVDGYVVCDNLTWVKSKKTVNKK